MGHIMCIQTMHYEQPTVATKVHLASRRIIAFESRKQGSPMRILKLRDFRSSGKSSCKTTHQVTFRLLWGFVRLKIRAQMVAAASSHNNNNNNNNTISTAHNCTRVSTNLGDNLFHANHFAHVSSFGVVFVTTESFPHVHQLLASHFSLVWRSKLGIFCPDLSALFHQA